MPLAAASIAALVAAACGGGSKTATTHALKSCKAAIGIEAPTTGPMARLGDEQLTFAKIAMVDDNKANGTHLSLVPGDTQLTPALATAVTQQMIANPAIVAVVGPAGNEEVKAVGPLLGRAGMAFISGSTTDTSLTDGANPTFFRVVAANSTQGPQDAHFVIKQLHPKALTIIDDGEAYSSSLVRAMLPVFRAAGINVDHESVAQNSTEFSSLVAKLSPRTTVAVLPWQLAANAQQFGRTLATQHKHVTVVATDRVYSPSSFTVPGAYVSWFAPDITAVPTDGRLVQQATAALTRFGTWGPPVYAATHVVDKAIAAVCKSGQMPTRGDVLSAIKASNEPTSILGEPIKFDSHGDLINAKWFLFHINSAGRYQLMTGP